jgi:hypothetical protein
LKLSGVFALTSQESLIENVIKRAAAEYLRLFLLYCITSPLGVGNSIPALVKLDRVLESLCLFWKKQPDGKQLTMVSHASLGLPKSF